MLTVQAGISASGPVLHTYVKEGTGSGRKLVLSEQKQSSDPNAKEEHGISDLPYVFCEY
jgi:hypothetical protein